MKNMGIIQGNTPQAIPLVVGKDTVYVHSNIREIEDGLYEYNEIQYGKEEYLTMLAEAQHDTEGLTVDLAYQQTLLELGVI